MGPVLIKKTQLVPRIRKGELSFQSLELIPYNALAQLIVNSSKEPLVP